MKKYFIEEPQAHSAPFKVLLHCYNRNNAIGQLSEILPNTLENCTVNATMCSPIGFSPTAAAATCLSFSSRPAKHPHPLRPSHPGERRRMLPTLPHCCALHHTGCVYESLCVRELLHRCLCESFLCLAEHSSWRIHCRDASSAHTLHPQG